MAALIFLLLSLAASLFKSKSRLEAENAALRRQLTVLQRKLRGRVQFANNDRLFFIQLYRWFPSVLRAITIIRPQTIVRWHRGASALNYAELAKLFLHPRRGGITISTALGSGNRAGPSHAKMQN
jgi:hypothetical protein